MERDRKIIRISVYGILVNIVLVAFKAIIGFFAGSIAILLDAVNNLSDALSSIITIIGTKLSAKKPDRKHPFGHGRVEYFSSVIIAVIVLLAGLTSLKEAAEKIVSPTQADYSVASLIIILVAVFVKFFFGRYVKKQGVLLHSGSLIASGTDALSDSVLSLSTFVAALISFVWHISLEGWLGAVLSVYIIRSAVVILRDTVDSLIGTRADRDTAEKLRNKILSYPNVRGVYDLTLHSYGTNKIWATAHIQVPDEMTAQQLHHLTRAIAVDLYMEFGIVLTIGVYAANTQGRYGEMQDFLYEIARDYPHLTQIHGFYADEEKHLITFDVILSFEEEHPDDVIRALRDRMKERFPDYEFGIILDTDYSE